VVHCPVLELLEIYTTIQEIIFFISMMVRNGKWVVAVIRVTVAILEFRVIQVIADPAFQATPDTVVTVPQVIVAIQATLVAMEILATPDTAVTAHRATQVIVAAEYRDTAVLVSPAIQVIVAPESRDTRDTVALESRDTRDTVAFQDIRDIVDRASVVIRDTVVREIPDTPGTVVIVPRAIRDIAVIQV